MNLLITLNRVLGCRGRISPQKNKERDFGESQHHQFLEVLLRWEIGGSLKWNGVETGFSFSFSSCIVREIMAHLYVDGKDSVERKIDDAGQKELLRNEWGWAMVSKWEGHSEAQKGGTGVLAQVLRSGRGDGILWKFSFACFIAFSKVL